jgi:hypothetical protein
MGLAALSAQPIPAPSPASGCGSTDGNVNAVASALGICEDLDHFLHPSESDRIQPEGPFQLFNEPGTPRPGGLRGVPGRRQRIVEKLAQGESETNLMLSLLDNSRLRTENRLLVNHVRAYRRSKFLNAVVGTGVQGLGTGLQFSSSTGVQRAGNYLGIAGGVLAIAFALCTAELPPLEKPEKVAQPALDILAPFSDSNQRHLIPKTLWSYMALDKPFVDHMNEMYKELLSPPRTAASKGKKILACRYNGSGEAENTIAEISSAFDELQTKARGMTEGMATLLDELDKPQ